jgi:hypothetical protein
LCLEHLVQDMTREFENDLTAKIRALIPETMAVVSRFVRDPVLEHCLPQCSSTGRRITVWPGLLNGANGVPVGTLLRLGGAGAAIWGSDFSSAFRALDDGTVEATRARPIGQMCADDFEITVARTTGYEWGDVEPSFMVSVRYTAAAAPDECRFIGIIVNGLDDARLARLVDVALAAKRYRLVPQEALLTLRDHAVCFGARQVGAAWCVPVGPCRDESPTDDPVAAPSM